VFLGSTQCVGNLLKIHKIFDSKTLSKRIPKLFRVINAAKFKFVSMNAFALNCLVISRLLGE
jgi:hypothetical protein